ncbi:MAG TPA: cation diffusion facilitator family transporter [Mycobacteriales bacterium]|nr:cation diffusion facilitator family transporter [Mycobacteriales bacterium]
MVVEPARAHRHEHGPGAHRDADERLLVSVLMLLVAFLVGEFAVALVVGSVALLADAGHLLVDAGSVAGALGASRLARRPAGGRWTFGLHRVEVLAAAINGLALVVAGALLTFEAVRRLWKPVDVDGVPVLVVAGVGLLVNLAATALLARADRTGLNMQGAFAHILTDLYAFLGTVVAGVVLVTTGFDRADSIASLLVVLLMFAAAVPLLRASASVLLEGVPEQVDLDEVRTHLLATPHVREVHDLHCWTVTSGLLALSAHVVVEAECFQDGHAPQMLDALQHCLLGHFDIDHSTFQLEPVGHAEHESGAHA